MTFKVALMMLEPECFEGDPMVTVTLPETASEAEVHNAAVQKLHAGLRDRVGTCIIKSVSAGVTGATPVLCA